MKCAILNLSCSSSFFGTVECRRAKSHHTPLTHNLGSFLPDWAASHLASWRRWLWRTVRPVSQIRALASCWYFPVEWNLFRHPVHPGSTSTLLPTRWPQGSTTEEVKSPSSANGMLSGAVNFLWELEKNSILSFENSSSLLRRFYSSSPRAPAPHARVWCCLLLYSN